jgi:hypothetical protein
VPLERRNIDISREGPRTVAYVSYTEPVEFFPSFTYPLDLSFMVEIFSVNPSNVQ